ncbi:MAG: DUF1987 domain-containing protein [Bacteroidales bacterium]|nr:DUF1987 domain-containing protein [Bacteroidales bacterium]MBN2756323.1 DUF1987 domain-containing protein [Bacteroidales bacterium]
MNSLIIEKGNNTFGITLDKENKIFLFEGRSLPENTVAFFQPVLEWLAKYAQSPEDETIVNMDFIYFNTSSAKLILDVLNEFDKVKKAGNKVKIIWHYMEEDFDIKEAGQEYESMVSIPFEYVMHPESYYD